MIVGVNLLLFGLLSIGGEVAIRIKRHKLFDFNKVGWVPSPVLNRHEGIAMPHAELGWAPKPNSATELHGNTQRTDDLGLRVSDSNGTFDGFPILAVGDSFTWGESVNDGETWPAYLEGITGHRVANGGVFGYGLDQIILRAERLIPDVEPGLLIIDYIGDDVSRCEFSYRNGRKPYFTVQNDRLELCGVPVDQAEPPVILASQLRSALKYSHLADYMMTRLAPTWWLSEHGIVRVHDDGVAVSKLLMERVRSIMDKHSLRTLVVFESGRGRDYRRGSEVLKYASEIGLPTLDLAMELQVQIDSHRHTDTPFEHGHLSKHGNRWVAERIAKKLREEKLID